MISWLRAIAMYLGSTKLLEKNMFQVKGSTIQTTYFQAISLMREAYYDLTGWLAEKKVLINRVSDKSKFQIELPFSTDILKDVLSIILPN